MTQLGISSFKPSKRMCIRSVSCCSSWIMKGRRRSLFNCNVSRMRMWSHLNCLRTNCTNIRLMNIVLGKEIKWTRNRISFRPCKCYAYVITLLCIIYFLLRSTWQTNPWSTHLWCWHKKNPTISRIGRKPHPCKNLLAKLTCSCPLTKIGAYC